MEAVRVPRLLAAPRFAITGYVRGSPEQAKGPARKLLLVTKSMAHGEVLSCRTQLLRALGFPHG